MAYLKEHSYTLHYLLNLLLHSSSLYTKLNILENNWEPLELVNRLINALY